MHDQLVVNKGINSHVTKSVVPLALVVCDYTHASNAVGMTDLVTPTLVGGKSMDDSVTPTSVGGKSMYDTATPTLVEAPPSFKSNLQKDTFRHTQFQRLSAS